MDRNIEMTSEGNFETNEIVFDITNIFTDLMFIRPCIILIVE